MESNNTRRPTNLEIRLIEFLVQKALLNLPTDWSENLFVRSMDDGQMGSLCLFPSGLEKSDRSFGRQASEFKFKDKDGTYVIASLYLDKAGDLFELDLWKVDFSALISLPDDYAVL